MILFRVREWFVLFLLTDRQRTLMLLVSGIDDEFPLGIAWWTSETILWDLGNRGYLDQ